MDPSVPIGDEYKAYSAKSMAAYRAPSLLQPHKARRAISDAHHGRIPPLIGFFSTLASLAITKLVAQLGFDFIWINWEHSNMSVETMTETIHQIQLVSESKTVALVRILGHDHAAIGYALDAGASIVESLKGINNLDSILMAIGEHIDFVWLGNLDCRVSMGLLGFWGEEPEWVSALETLRTTLAKHNMLYSGLATRDDEWLISRGDGRSLMFTSSDSFALLRAREELRHAKELFAVKDYSTLG
ncbi:Phosphoenolpyruvate/pyruvate domain-containing protein [Mollisia scopiformis]|uniref:Phosphoenolpyruvate/pyruvate domain-containing protein n=1 Tax=Mollisia scopiformis TaxID=149040 RepID=A0A132B1A8_MOLSC|nr:Phosphoenolpyruvate/pyruvate domain-containing protein [Mollisia scopiformis]KUJ06158.1 Phosphoenolpyruvate/pyruvate domain-containing protein [Mollisia scopiformis]